MLLHLSFLWEEMGVEGGLKTEKSTKTFTKKYAGGIILQERTCWDKCCHPIHKRGHS